MITVYGHGATLNEVNDAIPATPTGAGSRWQSVRHGDLIKSLKGCIKKNGWTIGSQKYALTQEGAVMAGAFTLKGVQNVDPGRGLELALGFINCNNRRYALKLTVGAEVTVCNNGLCTGDIILTHRHDQTLDLGVSVRDALLDYAVAARQISGTVLALKSHTVSNGDASDALIEMARRRLIGWATVGRVDKEYRHPSFPEHGTGTSWALLNAFTFAARTNINPTRQMETYNIFRSLLPGGDN